MILIFFLISSFCYNELSFKTTDMTYSNSLNNIKDGKKEENLEKSFYISFSYKFRINKFKVCTYVYKL